VCCYAFIHSFIEYAQRAARVQIYNVQLHSVKQQTWGPIYKISYDNLTIVPKIRLTCGRRLVYQNLTRLQGASGTIYLQYRRFVLGIVRC